MDTMLTVEEVAAILKVQPLTVRQMFREGRIRGFKIGKAWRTTMPILEEDITCMSRGAAPPRLEQATPSNAGVPVEKTAPVRKKRPKAAPETEVPAVPETAEVIETVAVAVEEIPTAPEVPAVEEADTGGRRKRKPAPEDHTDQQLLF